MEAGLITSQKSKWPGYKKLSSHVHMMEFECHFQVKMTCQKVSSCYRVSTDNSTQCRWWRFSPPSKRFLRCKVCIYRSSRGVVTLGLPVPGRSRVMPVCPKHSISLLTVFRLHPNVLATWACDALIFIIPIALSRCSRDNLGTFKVFSCHLWSSQADSCRNMKELFIWW